VTDPSIAEAALSGARGGYVSEDKALRGSESGQEAVGPAAEQAESGPALEELALAWVEADPSWNCRAPYAEVEILSAVERYRHEPMLHPPSVVRLGEERYQLVTGFLRFEVMKHLEHELGWFRVVSGSEVDRLLWNLGENTARRDLTGHELVERVWMLHSRGVSKERLLRACGFKIRYLNRMLFIRRRAHPELYEAFRTHPALSVARMARLCTHEPSQQMEEYRASEAYLARAAAVEQGYSEQLEEGGDAGEEDGSGDTRRRPNHRRRRLPSRDQVRRLLAMHEKSRHLDPGYRRGVVASLRHLLYGEPLPESSTASE
jgi:hypothetical protein